MKKKTKKKNPINIDEECQGKSVGSVREKKEKKLDLTEEIKNFLDSPIDLESIKYIFLRLHGPTSKYECEKSQIKVIGIKEITKNKIFDFIIMISKKNYSSCYYLGSCGMFEMRLWRQKSLETSELKSVLKYIIWNWLHKNQEKIIIV